MRTRTWSGAAIAVAVAFAGCAHHEKKTASKAPEAAAASEAQQAQQRAAETDRALAEEQRQLESTRQESAKAQQQQGQARQQLSQAEQQADQTQQRLVAQQANVQRLAAESRRQHDEAAHAAQRAESAAEQAALAAEEAQGLRSVAGRIKEASPDRLVMMDRNGDPMWLRLTPATKVVVGSEQRTLAELQQGADARVAYDPRQDEPAAVTIHVTRAAPAPTPAPPRK